LAGAPGASDLVTGDLATPSGMRAGAEAANGRGRGRFQAVIHNAAIGYREPERLATADRLPQLFAVNVLAPYVLTALIERPDRLVYLSSAMHRHVRPAPDDMDKAHRTQAWLATSDKAATRVSGGYFHALRPRAANPLAGDQKVQDTLPETWAGLSGLTLER